MTLLLYLVYIADSIITGEVRTAIASNCSRLWLPFLHRKVLFRQAFRGQGD